MAKFDGTSQGHRSPVFLLLIILVSVSFCLPFIKPDGTGVEIHVEFTAFCFSLLALEPIIIDFRYTLIKFQSYKRRSDSPVKQVG